MSGPKPLRPRGLGRLAAGPRLGKLRDMSESASNLSIEYATSERGTHCFRCTGEIDIHTAPQLEQAIDQVLAKGAQRIAVDLEAVTYIASAGVGLFVGNVNELKERGGGLVIVYSRHADALEGQTAMSEGYDVLQVFTLLGLDGVVPVVRDFDAAEAALGS
ncbi:MAG TPA: hypothetical protein DEA08_24105 [Planctomycetes bacterium]|nr:hypothetical protein [Planctomycetota bacterium]